MAAPRAAERCCRPYRAAAGCQNMVPWRPPTIFAASRCPCRGRRRSRILTGERSRSGGSTRRSRRTAGRRTSPSGRTSRRSNAPSRRCFRADPERLGPQGLDDGAARPPQRGRARSGAQDRPCACREEAAAPLIVIARGVRCPDAATAPPSGSPLRAARRSRRSPSCGRCRRGRGRRRSSRAGASGRSPAGASLRRPAGSEARRRPRAPAPSRR
jgi:hypothetical protein